MTLAPPMDVRDQDGLTQLCFDRGELINRELQIFAAVGG
jgi:hypothetical protein